MFRLAPILGLLCLSIFPVPNLATRCVVTEFNQVVNATATCTDIWLQDLVVPAGITLKLNLLRGTHLTFAGRTVFEFKHWYGPLVTLNGTNVFVKGDRGSIIDGQGKLYWDGGAPKNLPKPQFFTIEAFNSRFTSLHVINSPIDVVQVTNSLNVEFDDWLIDNSQGDEGVAPPGQLGHNTDGFDVWNSSNVIIRDSTVYNQDDCLAVRCGENMTIYNLYCHGSHGLSISSGFSKDDYSLNYVNNVTIRDSVLVGGGTGIHIKNHVDGGQGMINNVTYLNIEMTDASNYGIQIQQNYPTSGGDPVGNIKMTNFNFINVYGRVAKKAVPVYILCAKDEGSCANINFTRVSIEGSRNSNCTNFKPNGFDC